MPGRGRPGQQASGRRPEPRKLLPLRQGLSQGSIGQGQQASDRRPEPGKLPPLRQGLSQGSTGQGPIK
eukprot:398946-Alexandrium_andersonii.AAC.1